MIRDNFWFLTGGLQTTAKLTGITIAGGVLGGTALALARLGRNPMLRVPALAVIEGVRATPILMLIFWFYFMAPRVVGYALEASLAGILALVVFNSAYTAEIVRAGVQAVPVGQIEAARSTGLEWWPMFRHIVLPQAFQNMTPALINQAVMVYKTTSLVYVIGVVEFFRAATIVNNREFRPYEIYLFVAIVYFVPSTIGSRISRVLQGRRARSRA